jgi:hypothetical protein
MSAAETYVSRCSDILINDYAITVSPRDAGALLGWFWKGASINQAVQLVRADILDRR